jgi:predicted AAA+ superfamily ATPase
MVKVIRKQAMEKLRKLRDHDVIKVVTGIRRCGKSVLLQMFFDELLDTEITQDQVLALNFDSPENHALLMWQDLYNYVNEKAKGVDKFYLLLDEVQNVDQFENAVEALYLQKHIDIYITGSNSTLLSSELATKLTGRYVEIHLTPFSFAEYIELAEYKRTDLALLDYLNYGSIPGSILLFNDSKDIGDDYLQGIYRSIIFRDIVDKLEIRNYANLERLSRFMIDTIGSELSVNRISGALNQNGTRISNATVDNYLSALVSSYIFYPVSRFDLKGKDILRTLPKYYVADLGFKRVITSKVDSADYGHRLENAVYFELIRRFPKVYTGKLGTREIDFVCEDADGMMQFFQVAASVRDPKTFEREFLPLQTLKHSGAKTVITLDPENQVYDGIEKIGAAQWFLGHDVAN